MAPSERVLVEKLKATALEIFKGPEREDLSVKRVRDKLEAQLGLEKGFFTQAEWKDKSKKIVKEYATELFNREENEEDSIQVDSKPPTPKKPAPSPKKSAPANNKRAKKPTSAEKSRPAKRQKKQETPEESSELSDVASEESPASDFDDSDVSDAPKPKKNAARNSKTPVKRQSKKRAADSDKDEEEELSEESFGDEYDSDLKPKSKGKGPPKKATKPAPSSKGRPKKAQVETPESEESDAKAATESEDELTSAKKAKSKAKSAADYDADEPTPIKKSKPKTLASDAESDAPAPKKKATPAKAKPARDFVTSEDDTTETKSKANAIDSDSEMSVVLDEGPKPKRKRRSKSEMASGESKAPKPAKAPKQAKVKAPKASSNLSPAEEQLKTLQSQLVRCGVRKIWQFELKEHGDDTSAKIRHLQGMLKDIGMVGRFSDARAREIKEMRELQADLEAVKEGEKVWGMESGRPSRSKAPKKSLQISSDDDEDEDAPAKKAGGDDSEDDSDEQPPPRVPRAKQDLAFLGDEEDSDE